MVSGRPFENQTKPLFLNTIQKLDQMLGFQMVFAAILFFWHSKIWDKNVQFSKGRIKNPHGRRHFYTSFPSHFDTLSNSATGNRLRRASGPVPR